MRVLFVLTPAGVINSPVVQLRRGQQEVKDHIQVHNLEQQRCSVRSFKSCRYGIVLHKKGIGAAGDSRPIIIVLYNARIHSAELVRGHAARYSASSSL